MSGEVLEQYSFFTSRFYSAVDLETPDRPDIIMMTDCISKLQTMIDPYTHAVQITGRFRKGIGSITHITNWNSELKFQSREQILKDLKDEEEFYDRLVTFKETLTSKRKELMKEIEERTPFYRFMFKDDEHRGKVNPFLVECYIQKFQVASFYQNLHKLEHAYRDTGHFNVSYRYEPHAEQAQAVKSKKFCLVKES